MKKTTKGALAAGTAAFMMLGGAGTFAVWTDSDSVTAGTITTGFVSIDPVVNAATNTACSAWSHTNGAKRGSAVTAIVPGDVITSTCTFTIAARGDNLRATVTTPTAVTVASTTRPGGAAITPSPALTLPITAAYAINGTTATNPVIRETNNGNTLTATLTASFPYGQDPVANGNDTQNLLASLNALTVTLKQDDTRLETP